MSGEHPERDLPEGGVPDLDSEAQGVGLWAGDTGTLHDASRRALLRLLQGP